MHIIVCTDTSNDEAIAHLNHITENKNMNKPKIKFPSNPKKCSFMT